MVTNEFASKIQKRAEADKWVPEDKYSVFNAYDSSNYKPHRDTFNFKYRVIKAAVELTNPSSIVELGTHNGAGANALLSGAKWMVRYTGYDSFGACKNEDGDHWDPLVLVKDMFRSRNYTNYHLEICDLRCLDRIERGEFVYVDAGHDYRNAFQDLVMALQSDPKWILFDDYNGEETRLAADDFLKNFQSDISGTCFVNNCSGSLLIEMA